MKRREQWPSPSAERWLLVATRYPATREAALASARTEGWKRATLLSRILFFVLGLCATGATVGIFAGGDETFAFIAAGTIVVVAAEVLIARRRTLTSGFEEALWIAGSLLLVAGLVDTGFGNDFDALAWASAVALSLATWRLRNPLAATLAAIAVAVAVSEVGDDASGRWLAAGSCYAIATAALALGGRCFERPSTDRILDWLVVALPVVGWGALQVMRETSPWLLLPPLLFAMLAGVAGIRRRTHAPLIALLGCLACLGYGMAKYTPLEWHWRLIFGGAVGLLASIAIERWLRTPRQGISSLDLGEDLSAVDLARYAGAGAAASGAAAPAGGSATAPGVQGDGGRFGGAGAGQRY